MRMTLAVATVAVATLLPCFLAAQEDDGDASLGDVARSLRKKTPSSQEVIDNDNLSRVMDEVESHRLAGSSLLFSMEGAGKSFQVSSPDVTCSLSFSANAKALLSSQYAQLELPESELRKLDGPATIEGDSLQVSVFNGTNWHVSEVAVALTIVKRTDDPDTSADYEPTRMGLPVVGDAAQAPNQSEKRSDVTVLYRMRAAAVPTTTTVFRAPLNVVIGPGQEWHWAIVQAKGYPPQRDSDQTSQVSALAAPQYVVSPAQEATETSAQAPLQPNRTASVH